MVTLQNAELFRIELTLRMPFRYGIATLTELPHVILRAAFAIDGAVHTGFAADNIPPKWFTKDPARAPGDEIAEMIDVIRAAIAQAGEIRATTPFAFWRELYAAQAAWAAQRKMPPLLAHFGTSFVERVMIDAFCRAQKATFAAALRENLFAIDLGSVHAPLHGSAPHDWLPAKPSAGVFARHTVGLSDPLDSGELAPADRVNDGLPQTLVECVRAYGLRHFKIKINGETARDRSRLAGMARIFATECRGDFAFSLDGNESFREVGAFADYVRALMAAPELQALWPRLLFIEQPWHRDVALSPEIGTLAQAWPDRPPIIVDESDGEIGSVARALALGYAGASHKNCKGVFKSVANACLLAQHRAAGARTMLSGEDLTNLGPVALTQDLAAAATLGITTVERNGHHYFAGLSQFPPALQAHVLAQHGDLFTRAAQGWPRVDVREGKIALGTVNTAPFGVAGDLDLSGVAGERVG